MNKRPHARLSRLGLAGLLPALLLIALTQLPGCAITPEVAPPAGEAKPFEVPRRSDPLTPEQEAVRAEATAAVEANVDGYLARYVALVTSEHDAEGKISVVGVSDLEAAMALGPLTISADDMRELFPQYSATAASRSTHSVSVHEAVTAMAQELYERALAIDDPRGNNAVLFTAGGVASGKTTAIRTIDAVQWEAQSAQIIYDSTLRRYTSAKRRVSQALAADKSVIIVYVFTPIERSVKWLVNRAVKTGRVVPADVAARSHWQSQQTFLQLLEEFEADPAVSFLLINNSGDEPRLAKPSSLRDDLYASSGRFPDMDAFMAYTRELVRPELDEWRSEGQLIPETEAAFSVGN